MASFLSGCNHHDETCCQLAEMDSLIYTNPRRVLVQLDSIDAARALSKHEQMHLELLRGAAMNKADSLFTTDSVMLKVAEYYDRHGSANERMQAHYTLGCAYRDMGNAPRAVACYQKAVHSADTLSQDCDLLTLTRIHSQMANLYTQQKLFEEAIQEAYLAEKYSWKMKDTLSALVIEGQICATLYNVEKIDDCIQRTSQLFKKCKKMKLDDEAALLCHNLAWCYMDKGEYDTAKDYFDKYENSSYQCNPELLKNGLAPYFVNKGRYYLNVGAVDSAEYYYRKALEYKQYLSDDGIIYHGLLETYQDLSLPDSVQKYALLYAEKTMQHFDMDAADATLRMKALYNYNVEQEIARKKAAESDYHRVRYLMVLVISSCAALLVLLYVVNLYRNSRKEQKANERLVALLQESSRAMSVTEMELNKLIEEKEQLESHILRTEEEKAQMKSEIENRIKENEAYLHRLKGQVEFLQNELEFHGKGEEKMALADTPIVKHFRHLVDHPPKKQQNVPIIKEAEWRSFQLTMEQTYPNLYARLHMHDKVSESDYRMCLLILAGFGPSAIALLMEKRNASVSASRKRMLQKIFGLEGKPEEFDEKLRLLV